MTTAVILAGGLGTRLSEETGTKPKPMVDIGGRPILWHILKIYYHQGVSDFIICCGYKGDVIKDYFANYQLQMSDITFDMVENKTKIHAVRSENWRITLVDTGAETMTGGRLRRVAHLLDPDEDFFFTYGDGVGDIDIREAYAFHKKHGRQATLTAAHPPGRFGALAIEDHQVKSFREKPKGDGARVNAGFFVLSPKVIDLVEDDATVWEEQPLETLANRGELMAFRHDGFWQPMDTLRDRIVLEDLWKKESPPWKIW